MASERRRHSEGYVRDLAGSAVGAPVHDLTALRNGAWSESWAFTAADERLVIRVADRDDDFERDAAAAGFATRHLPVPEIRSIGTTPDGYYAVSTFADGEPLEYTTWDTGTVSATMHLLEALRTTDIGDTTGWGPWDERGRAPHDSWRAYLLSVAEDTPGTRTHGWRPRLDRHPTLARAFDDGWARLDATAIDDVPRSLVHGDLLNDNVRIRAGEITGVFDWGASIHGDHLYDLAGILFWEPRLPAIRADDLLDALRRRWRHRGYQATRAARRLLACQLHIGLEHLAYHTWRDDPDEAGRIATRLGALSDE